MITQKECIETTDMGKDIFYKLAQIREILNKRAGKHNQNYEGVIFFVSLRFYFSLIFSIDYCQNSQYLQGFVGSGIKQKAIDTKLNTLPKNQVTKLNRDLVFLS